MPYKFPALKKYTINYDILFKELIRNSTNKLFSDENLTLEYISNFVNAMEQVDVMLQESIKDTDLKRQLTSYYFETQVFQIPIFFSSQTIYVQFRITEILNILKEQSEDLIENISKNEFTGVRPKYKISPTDKLGSTPNSVPIIAVPYPYEYYDFLIIDGNNRIERTLNNPKITHYPVAHIDPNSLILNELFCSDFDRIFYTLHCDASILANLRENHSFNDKKLLEHTILNTGRLATEYLI